MKEKKHPINIALPKKAGHHKLLCDMAGILEQFYKTFSFTFIF